ncbi:MAG TPA: ATPase, T2SS/T4P/T4SS family [Longimicrobiales bacterium]|nr:ATPase, T2SS/T4P/T4SS family [Longimicrobiales bacterium]
MPARGNAPSAQSTSASHWLVEAARRARLPGADRLELAPTVPVTQAWAELQRACVLPAAELVRTIAGQLRLQPADFGAADPEARSALPEALAARYGVLPLSTTGSVLVLATADPFNYDAERALAFATGCKLQFVLATPAAIRNAAGRSAERVETSTADLDDLLTSIGGQSDAEIRLEAVEEVDDTDPLAGIDSGPVVRLTQLILREAIRQRASDVHLEPDQGEAIVRFRVDGVIRPYIRLPLPFHDRLVSRLKILARLDISNRLRPQDGQLRLALDDGSYSLRLSTVPTANHEKAVLRVIGNDARMALDDLLIAPVELRRLRELMNHRDGLIIVTGPTGSGKTTTLYSILEELRELQVNIVTVEDPVEQKLVGVTQIEVRPHQGVTFPSALRAILRQDPDVVLIGEIRDGETAQIAVQAAMTGHLVLATLHTVDAVSAIARLTDLGVDTSLLSVTLRGVLAQRLARLTCTVCDGAGTVAEPAPETADAPPSTCDHCGGTGFRGRLPLTEVLIVNAELRDLIHHRRPERDMERVARAAGMRTMRAAAHERVLSGQTTEAELHRVLGGVQEAVPVEGELIEPETESDTVSPRGNEARLPGTSEPGTSLVATGWEEDAPGQAPMRSIGGRGPTEERDDRIRLLLQGLDRGLSEGQTADAILQFACEQLASVFSFPLVWAGLVDGSLLRIRTRAGELGPFLRDVVDHWELNADGTGPLAEALRSGEPQASMIRQDEGFATWREFARMHDLPILLVVPLVNEGQSVGALTLHARRSAALDDVAGKAILLLAGRLADVLVAARAQEQMRIHLAALRSSVDAVLTLGPDGRIEWVNQSFVQLTGYTSEEAVGQTLALLHSDEGAASDSEVWNRVVAGHAWRGEVLTRMKDGTVHRHEQTLTRVQDGVAGRVNYVVVLRPESKARAHTLPGALQHLPDRATFERRLHASVAQAADGGAGLLLAIRVDGHAALVEAADPAVAEQLLTTVAVTLHGGLRSGDVMAYLGDAEFAVLMPDLAPHLALSAADRLRMTVESYRFGPELAWAMPTLSIGMLSIDGSLSPADALETARGTYLKDSRSGLIHYHAPVTVRWSDDAARWSQRIEDALENDHLRLFFQPVIEIETGRVQHFDALLRMQAPNGDVVPAGAFMRQAESLSLLPRIDEWVIGAALDLLEAEPSLRLSLNISTMSLTDPRFRSFVRRRQKAMAWAGGRLLLEVSEMIRDMAQAEDRMAWLRDSGCRFILDNFGVTPAALASLGALPVEFVKLDGRLIRGLDSGDVSPSLIQAIATVARAIDKRVIAGWAENENVLRMLPGLGVQYAQGYHIGVPTSELVTRGVRWAS